MMLMLAHSPPPHAIHAENRFARMVNDLSISQGDDGRRIAEGLREALVHWFDRAECLLEIAATDDLELQAVQLRKAGTVRVRYRPGGRLRVAPYAFDDE
jgi:hypothetical protein